MSSLETRGSSVQSRSCYLTIPPLLRGQETVEGSSILSELPNPTGLLLWKCFRDVMLWVSEPGSRTEAFDAEFGPGVAGPVRSLGLPVGISAGLTILLGIHAAPFAIAEGDVAEACLAVAGWARAEGHPVTELAYTQAAALLRPDDAVLAYRVGRLARERSEFPRAETWFRKAIGLARHDDWDTYTLSYIALANLYISVGNYPVARELSQLAYRTSLRHALKGYAGMAQHALFIIAAEGADTKEANGSAMRAFELYGPSHPRIRALAHDVASFWANMGQFARALQVFEASLPHFSAPNDFVLVAANAARAAAAIGNRATYELRWTEVHAVLPRCTSEPRIGDALLVLARAAGSMGDFEHAREAAVRVREVAERCGLAQLKLQAEAELEAIQAEAVTASSSGRSESFAAQETAERLAGDLVATLGSAPAVELTLQPCCSE